MLAAPSGAPQVLGSLLRCPVGSVEDPGDTEHAVEQVLLVVGQGRRACERRKQGVAMRSAMSKLSARERQILDRLLGGEHNKRIAHALGISPKTVAAHRAHFLKKLGVGDLLELDRLLEARQ